MGNDRPSAGVSARRVGGAIASAIYGAAAVGLPYLRAGVSAGILDLLVGWILLGCGIALSERRPGSRPAIFLIASGVAWFAVDFAPLVPSGARRLVEGTALLYLALLAHAVLVLPGGRLRGDVSRLAAAVVWAVAAASAAGYYRVGLLVFGTVMIVASLVRWAQTPARSSTSTLATLGAGVVLGAGELITAALRLSSSPPSEPVLARSLYVPLVLTAMLVYIAGSIATDFPIGIELVDAADGALEATIGHVLGYGPVSVAFPTRNGEWIGFSGEQVTADIERAFLVRDSVEVLAALGPGEHTHVDMTDGVRDLLRLCGAHARLQRDMRSQLEELAQSRRRLLDAGDTERRRLEVQLRQGAIARIDRVGALLEDGISMSSLDERLAVTRRELDGIARGIEPLANVPLDQALQEMSKQSPLAVTLEVTGAAPGGRAGRAIWYTCSEALANAAKHAPDSSVSITVARTSTEIVATVADNGPGGADPRGTGLRGLADRAAALGGSLSVTSGHRGTRLVLALPIVSEV